MEFGTYKKKVSDDEMQVCVFFETRREALARSQTKERGVCSQAWSLLFPSSPWKRKERHQKRGEGGKKGEQRKRAIVEIASDRGITCNFIVSGFSRNKSHKFLLKRHFWYSLGRKCCQTGNPTSLARGNQGGCFIAASSFNSKWNNNFMKNTFF